MENAIINLNGEILGPDEAPEKAKVSVFDRSFLYGDSLYEVVRTYGGKFFHMDDHLTRLEDSAKLCRMRLSQPLETYARECERTLAVFWKKHPTTEAYCRIIVSRGVGRIGFSQSCVLTPTQYVIIVQPLELPSQEKIRKGLKLQVSKRLRNDRRALDPAMKSGNYLNSVLAYLEAEAEGYDDALLCNSDAHLTEGTTFNIGYLKRGILATPPLDIGILDGITRRVLIDIAREMGIPVREVRFPKERLYEADEVFATSSIKEVFPVTQVDDVRIHGGKPGPLTMKLREEFQKTLKKLH